MTRPKFRRTLRRESGIPRTPDRWWADVSAAVHARTFESRPNQPRLDRRQGSPPTSTSTFKPQSSTIKWTSTRSNPPSPRPPSNPRSPGTRNSPTPPRTTVRTRPTPECSPTTGSDRVEHSRPPRSRRLREPNHGRRKRVRLLHLSGRGHGSVHDRLGSRLRRSSPRTSSSLKRRSRTPIGTSESASSTPRAFTRRTGRHHPEL